MQTRLTTVTIRINRDQVENAVPIDFEATASGALMPPGTAGTIVYIEDDPVNILLMEQYVALREAYNTR